MKDDRKIIAMICAVLALVIIGRCYLPESARDSTDTKTARSGMKLFTDALTGCQYLSVGDGGLTPRIDSDGEPVCNEDVLK